MLEGSVNSKLETESERTWNEALSGEQKKANIYQAIRLRPLLSYPPVSVSSRAWRRGGYVGAE
jgi:hypothetical protein